MNGSNPLPCFFIVSRLSSLVPRLLTRTHPAHSPRRPPTHLHQFSRYVYGADVIDDTTLAVLSRTIAILLVSMYISYLYFQLKTHTESFCSTNADNENENFENDLENDFPNETTVRNADRRNTSLGGVRALADQPLLGEDYTDDVDIEPVLSLAGALGGLTLVTIAVAACSEYLTGSIEAVAASTQINKSFLGIILLPIAGNAAEHFTAVFLAMRNKMDAAISIAVGSSIQIAVFVLPVTVLVGWCVLDICIYILTPALAHAT